MTIAPPTGGTITVQASVFKSSDGTSGFTGTLTTALLIGKTLTFKDGLITAFA